MKKIVVTLIALLLVISLVACANVPTTVTGAPTGMNTSATGTTAIKTPAPAATDVQAKKLKVGIIVITMEGNSFQIDMGNAAVKEAESFGCETLLGGAKDFSDFTGQLNLIEDYISKKVDLIMISCSNADALVPGMEAAKAAGIPVVVIDQGVNSDYPITYIGTDNTAAAKAGVEYLLKKMGGSGELLHLEGAPGIPATTFRKDGMLEALKDFPDVKLVMSQSGMFTEQGGLDVTETAFQAHPNIKAIFCANDNMALGAAEASKAAGKSPLIMGFDGIPTALDAIKAGTIDSTVSQWPAKMAALGVRIGLSWINYLSSTGTDFPHPFPAFIDSGGAIITKENVADFIK